MIVVEMQFDSFSIIIAADTKYPWYHTLCETHHTGWLLVPTVVPKAIPVKVHAVSRHASGYKKCWNRIRSKKMWDLCHLWRIQTTFERYQYSVWAPGLSVVCWMAAAKCTLLCMRCRDLIVCLQVQQQHIFAGCLKERLNWTRCSRWHPSQQKSCLGLATAFHSMHFCYGTKATCCKPTCNFRNQFDRYAFQLICANLSNSTHMVEKPGIIKEAQYVPNLKPHYSDAITPGAKILSTKSNACE